MTRLCAPRGGCSVTGWRRCSVGDMRGQSTVEYALIIAAVVAAMVTMGTYVRRSVQANFKHLEETVNGAVEDP